MNRFLKTLMTGTLVAAMAISLASCNNDKEPPNNQNNDQIVKPGTNSGNTGDENNTDISVGKLEAATLETYLRSYRVAFEQVARENAGFNTFGWDTGDNAGGLSAGATITLNEKTYTYTNADKDAGDRIRNAYDEGDMNLNGMQDDGETFTGRKVYVETWTGNYTLNNPANPDDKSAYDALEHAINANLDPKFQIELSYDGTFTTSAADPWGTNFHGTFITNTLEDKTDRGAFIIFSNGLNKSYDTQANIANGAISFTGNTDDFYLSTIYTYKNGYGEVVSDMRLPTVKEDNNANNNTENNHPENNNSNNNNQNQDDNQNTNNTVEIVDVDWNQLITVDFGQWNGYATPTLTVNYDYFETLVLTKNVKDFADSQTYYAVKRLLDSDVDNWFIVEFEEQYQNVKNGDVLNIKVILDDTFEKYDIGFGDFKNELGINFNDGTKSFTVSNLEEPKCVIDLFSAMESFAEYNGANGFGSASIFYIEIPTDLYVQFGDVYLVYDSSYYAKLVYQNKSIAEFQYYVTGSNLSQGDVAIMHIDPRFIRTDLLEEMGYVIPGLTKEIIVPDLGDYVTKQEQITSDVLAELLKVIEEDYNSNGYDALYLANYKPSEECKYNVTTVILGAYYQSGWWSSGYKYDVLAEVIIKPDGTIEISDSYDSIEYETAEARDAAIDKYYTFVKIYEKIEE